MGVHHPFRDDYRGPPCGIDQLLAAQHPARAADEGRQQPEFQGTEVYGLSAAADLTPVEVDLTIRKPIDSADFSVGIRDGNWINLQLKSRERAYRISILQWGIRRERGGHGCGRSGPSAGGRA